MPTTPESSLSSVAAVAEIGQHWHQHRPRLLAMLERRIDPRLSVRIGAEAILNDAFLDAVRLWPQYLEQPTQSIYGWLYGVVYKRYVETWRQHVAKSRDLHRDIPWPDQTSVQMGLGIIDRELTPGAAAVREELRQLVQQTLALLSSDDREILWMIQTDQLKVREAAAVLQITDNAASRRYRRALERFKELWRQIEHSKGTGS